MSRFMIRHFCKLRYVRGNIVRIKRDEESRNVDLTNALALKRQMNYLRHVNIPS